MPKREMWGEQLHKMEAEKGEKVPNSSWGKRSQIPLHPAQGLGLALGGRSEHSLSFVTFSSISSSRSCGARPQPPPCPGPGPAPHRHSRLMRRSPPGQVMVRRSGRAGDRPWVDSGHQALPRLTAFLIRVQSCLQPQTAVENPEDPEPVRWRVSGDHRHPEGAWPGP